jgi:hypothetical protein
MLYKSGGYLTFKIDKLLLLSNCYKYDSIGKQMPVLLAI